MPRPGGQGRWGRSVPGGQSTPPQGGARRGRPLTTGRGGRKHPAPTQGKCGRSKRWTPLALDAAGRPHIGYYDWTDGDLKYAHLIECVAVEEVTVAGPALLPLGIAGLYSATYSPLSATVPVDLAWDNDRSFGTATVGPTAVYSWTMAGTHTLGVTATNPCSQTLGSFTVTVFCQPLEGVEVTGPRSLLVSQTGTYRAVPLPITASRPLTFTWDNDRSEGTATVGPTASYSWSTTGRYTITVTGTNICGGEAAGRLLVRVLEEWPYDIYLPLLVRG